MQRKRHKCKVLKVIGSEDEQKSIQNSEHIDFS